MDVVIRHHDICRVKLTEFGNEIYDKFCKKEHDRWLEAEYLWYGQCPTPELVVPFHWLMLIFGRHLDPEINGKKRVFADGIHLR